MLTLAELNNLPAAEFTHHLAEIFEHSSWVAAAAAGGRPFGSIDDLHRAMVAIVDAAEIDRQLALLNAHPELAAGGKLTAASASEQGAKGLDRLGGAQADLLTSRNAAYRQKFGFPFIIAVRGQRDLAMILEALAARLANAPDQERGVALSEVAKIARFRLQDIVDDKDD